MTKKRRALAGLVALGYLVGTLYYVSTIPDTTRSGVWSGGNALITNVVILAWFGSDLLAAFVCLGVMMTFLADLWEWAFE